MGGAQPLAVTMNEGACLIVDVDESRLRRRVEHRYLDEVAGSLDEAIDKAVAAKNERRAWSVGVVGNAAAVFPELLRRGVPIDIVTDQTSAHDPLSYLPEGIELGDWHEYAEKKPEEFTDRARESMAKHVQAMVEFQDAGAEVFDYGNSIRDEARKGGYDRAFEFPGFVPAYIRPLFCEGKGPFRWAALSGDPKDIAATDKAVLDLFPDNERLHKWIRGAQDRIAFQGLPARICWLGQGERDKAGLAFNELVRTGEVSAPIVIGRDHLDTGSVASPYRETEAMLDGSDAIADWPLLNALVNTSSGASLGLDPPRRRRRHRPLAARRTGLAGRRHRARRPEARPRPDQRPRHGRHPARRRRLRHCRADRRRSRASGSRCARADRPTSGGHAGRLDAVGDVRDRRHRAPARRRRPAPSPPRRGLPRRSRRSRPATVASATTGHGVVEPNGVMVPRSYPVTSLAVAASGIDMRLTPSRARSLGQEISRSPGTRTKR